MVDRSADPRAQRSRDRILSAAVALLSEKGLVAVTHRAVAARAGVGRATVYRHWPDPVDLRLAALSAGAHALPEPLPRWQTGHHRDPRTDLTHRVCAIAAQLNKPASSILALVIGNAEYDEGTRRLRQRLVTRAVDWLHPGVDAAIGRGQLRADVTADAFAVATVGPLCYQRFLVGASLDDRTVAAAVEAATRACAPPAPALPSPATPTPTTQTPRAG